MAKYFGTIGYALPKNSAPGVVSYDDIEERQYYGDIVSNATKWNSGETLNDNLVMQDSISIVADEFAYTHSSRMRYATLYGTKWRIKSVSIARPRITISLGDVYNEQ